MRHIIMFSGGIGGYECARRIKAAVDDPATITLLFADTQIEDEDLYRFRDEAAGRLNLHLETIADGRDPWGVFFDERFLGNTRADPCSKLLKRKLLRKWLDDNCQPHNTIVYLGLDWIEQHRIAGAWARWAPWAVRFPLAEPPYEFKHDWLDQCRRDGIEPPRLYKHGFPHNNCGGFCVKGGQAQFAKLLRVFPDRYRWHEEREQELREFLGKDVAILRDRRGGETRPLTLRELRQRLEADAGAYDQQDWGACGCFTEAAA